MSNAAIATFWLIDDAWSAAKGGRRGEGGGVLDGHVGGGACHFDACPEEESIEALRGTGWSPSERWIKSFRTGGSCAPEV